MLDSDVAIFLKRNRRGFLRAIKACNVGAWLISLFQKFRMRFPYHVLSPSDHLLDAEQRQLQVCVLLPSFLSTDVGFTTRFLGEIWFLS